MPNIVVIADCDWERRRGTLAKIPRYCEIHECDSRASLLQRVRETLPDAVVIGALNDDIHPIESVAFVRNIHPPAKIILVVDGSSESLAIAALRMGVHDYLRAPVTAIEIAESVGRAVPPAQEPVEGFDSLVGASKEILEVKALVSRIAPFNSTVLVTGESGTGKEIVARLIHRHSARSIHPFISLNCAAIPDTLVESELFGHERGAFTGAVARQTGQIKNADHGTLFLDEIGDMSLLAQSKMLRVLEQQEIQPLGCSRTLPVDVRLIAATHRNLERLIVEQAFRSDLYYRLDVVRIHLTPLRDRPDDIPLLASHFLSEMNDTYRRHLMGFTPAALDLLMRNPWPGNIRQLRNVIEAAGAVCESDRISDRDLRASHTFRASEAPGVKKSSAPCIATKMVKPDKDEVIRALELTRWNMTHAAQLLKWSRSTLYRNIARHKIDLRTTREPQQD